MALRVAVAIAALVPVGAGLAGIVFGSTMLGGGMPSPRAGADGHFRYLSGLLLAIGLAFWSAIPAIERQTSRFRLLAAIVVVGGIGRLVGLAINGRPTAMTIAALAMELLVTPGLCLWQGRVARIATTR